MNLKILISSALAATAITAGGAYAQDASTATAAQDQAGQAMHNVDPTATEAAPADQAVPPAADSATTNAAPASATTTNMTLTNGPVADTPENRAKYKPLSRAGQHSAAKGD
jgi:hypothetical protein